jgi:hypothetical protein
MPSPPDPRRHPAETAGVAGSAALLIAHTLGVTDPTTIVAIGVVIGFVPSAVTWVVELRRGGVGGAA